MLLAIVCNCRRKREFGLEPFLVFFFMQDAALLALMNLDAAEQLDAAWRDYRFALLTSPKALNFMDNSITSDPLSARHDSFGFSYSYLLVQE